MEDYNEKLWNESIVCNDVAIYYDSLNGCSTPVNASWISVEKELNIWYSGLTVERGTYLDPLGDSTEYFVLEHNHDRNI